MNLTDFISHFAEQFDDTDVSGFTATTEFKQLDEWSSLLALSIIAMADEIYNVRLKGEDIRSSSTIDDLYHKVKAKL